MDAQKASGVSHSWGERAKRRDRGAQKVRGFDLTHCRYAAALFINGEVKRCVHNHYRPFDMRDHRDNHHDLARDRQLRCTGDSTYVQ